MKVQDGKSLPEIVSCFAEQIYEASLNCGWENLGEKIFKACLG